MSGSNRIRGAALALQFGGTDHWADVTSVTIENEEAPSDQTTFADAKAGGARQFYFNISAIQSTDPSSFWSMTWGNTGSTVAYRYAPHGNAVATAEEPHFLGTCKVGAKPNIGGAAGATTEFGFETRFDIIGEPEVDRGASAGPIITSVTPGKAEGDLAVIAGTRFGGATAVTFDGDAVPFIRVSDTTLSVTVGAAGPVIVTTPEGASVPFAYTVVTA
jgi:hypothetical protein